MPSAPCDPAADRRGAYIEKALTRAPAPGWARSARTGLKRIAREVLAAEPSYRILKARALRGDPVTVLCYHTLGPDRGGVDAWTVLRMEDFRRQVDFLRAHYDIVDLDAALASDPALGGRPRAVISFDDGEAGLHRYLLPFVESEQLPVTVYVATGQIETGAAYWFDKVMSALQAPGAFMIDLTPAGLPAWTIGPETGAARWAVISDILETLKAAAPPDRARLAAAITAQAPAPAPDLAPLAPMTVAQIGEMARSRWITIAAHSHCHNLLDQIPLAAVRESAARSRALLEAWTGKPVRHFAYPNGNYREALAAAMPGLGFRSAAALGMTLWRNGTDPFALPRVAIGRYDDFDRFRLRLIEL